jgi:phage FluMu protein Com
LCCLFFFKEDQTTQWQKNTKGQSESIYQRRTDNTMAKRYQRGNQNLYIKEEQTTQWPKDTKGAIRIYMILIALWYLLAIVLSVLL